MAKINRSLINVLNAVNTQNKGTFLKCHMRKFMVSPACLNKFQKGLINPLEEFKPNIQVPILEETDWVFKPSNIDVEKVQHHFRPTASNPIVALKGVGNFHELPETDLPEVAFIGRSNVGKSSLIKALFFNPIDTKISISKKPGHTTAIKVYKIKKAFSLVDMPGYGKNMPSYFKESVEDYLQNRKNLCRTFILFDTAPGITEIDKTGVEMLEEFGIPYCAVFTKIDKCSLLSVFQKMKDFSNFRYNHMPGCLPQPFLVSSNEDCGIGFLRAFIAHVTGILK